MSRIGNRELVIPQGVSVTLEDGFVVVKGSLGELKEKIADNLTVNILDDKINIVRSSEAKATKQLHGTLNSNISNMLEGVSKGFTKGLEIVGVGYKFNLQGKKLVINAGYSHQVTMEIPTGLTVNSLSNTEITVSGIAKSEVGEYAANIRKVRKPEPYKGKGIRYKNEHVRRKEGKKAA